ncbi:tetratricopeptide repeat protein, partial [Candidatus Poribacteria bacterium]|nr:tetratricopeptide repeat protein [Candidatus Poribacteria bacterium]
MNKGLKIFITYAHKNSEAKDKLITHLAVMKQNGLIDVWHDNEILPGDKWRDAIFNNLADSDILLYLTCPYSLASENCNKELTAALNPNIRVIPIILEHCDWQNHQLSEFQALPEKGKPIYDISEWNPESKGWMSVVAGIRKVVNEMQSQAKPSPSVTPEEIETLAFLAFHRGNFMMMLDQIDEALKVYSRVIELSPNNAEAYNNRGCAFQMKGEYNRATADYSKAIEISPDCPIFYNNRGAAYSAKGEYDRAIEEHNKAIEINPN